MAGQSCKDNNPDFFSKIGKIFKLKDRSRSKRPLEKNVAKEHLSSAGSGSQFVTGPNNLQSSQSNKSFIKKLLSHSSMGNLTSPYDKSHSPKHKYQESIGTTQERSPENELDWSFSKKDSVLIIKEIGVVKKLESPPEVLCDDNNVDASERSGILNERLLETNMSSIGSSISTSLSSFFGKISIRSPASMSDALQKSPFSHPNSPYRNPDASLKVPSAAFSTGAEFVISSASFPSACTESMGVLTQSCCPSSANIAGDTGVPLKSSGFDSSTKSPNASVPSPTSIKLRESSSMMDSSVGSQPWAAMDSPCAHSPVFRGRQEHGEESHRTSFSTASSLLTSPSLMRHPSLALARDTSSVLKSASMAQLSSQQQPQPQQDGFSSSAVAGSVRGSSFRVRPTYVRSLSRGDSNNNAEVLISRAGRREQTPHEHSLNSAAREVRSFSSVSSAAVSSLSQVTLHKVAPDAGDVHSTSPSPQELQQVSPAASGFRRVPLEMSSGGDNTLQKDVRPSKASPPCGRSKLSSGNVVFGGKEAEVPPYRSVMCSVSRDEEQTCPTTSFRTGEHRRFPDSLSVDSLADQSSAAEATGAESSSHTSSMHTQTLMHMSSSDFYVPSPSPPGAVGAVHSKMTKIQLQQSKTAPSRWAGERGSAEPAFYEVGRRDTDGVNSVVDELSRSSGLSNCGSARCAAVQSVQSFAFTLGSLDSTSKTGSQLPMTLSRGYGDGGVIGVGDSGTASMTSSSSSTANLHQMAQVLVDALSAVPSPTTRPLTNMVITDPVISALRNARSHFETDKQVAYDGGLHPMAHCNSDHFLTTSQCASVKRTAATVATVAAAFRDGGGGGGTDRDENDGSVSARATSSLMSQVLQQMLAATEGDVNNGKIVVLHSGPASSSSISQLQVPGGQLHGLRSQMPPLPLSPVERSEGRKSQEGGLDMALGLPPKANSAQLEKLTVEERGVVVGASDGSGHGSNRLRVLASLKATQSSVLALKAPPVEAACGSPSRLDRNAASSSMVYSGGLAQDDRSASSSTTTAERQSAVKWGTTAELLGGERPREGKPDAMPLQAMPQEGRPSEPRQGSTPTSPAPAAEPAAGATKERVAEDKLPRSGDQVALAASIALQQEETLQSPGPSQLQLAQQGQQRQSHPRLPPHSPSYSQAQVQQPQIHQQKQLLSEPPQPRVASPMIQLSGGSLRPLQIPEVLPRYQLLHVSSVLLPGMRRSHWSLGDFQLIRKLYKGYSSSVYKAICTRSQQPVALKVYSLVKMTEFLRHQALREVDVHSRQQHKNIINLLAAFVEDRQYLVLVQEYARGGDLYRVARKLGGRVSERQVVGTVLQPLLLALQYMHEGGICHRDIKPENVLFTEDWALKLGDFGVAVDLRQERAVTRTGTADYMAPEVQVCPLKRRPGDNKDNPLYGYTVAVDAWSVGVLVYELLVGFPPFPAAAMGQKKKPLPAPAAKPAASSSTTEKATSAAAVGSDSSASRETTTEKLSPAAAFAQSILFQPPSFPASISGPARDFVLTALRPRPEERMTVQGMLHHPWINSFKRNPNDASFEEST